MKKLSKLLLLIFICLISSNVNAASLNCNYTYKNGSRGDNVKILQMQLNVKAACGIDVDGIFGNKTKECVKKYQRKYGLSVDGIVGRQTCNSLNGTTTQTPSPSPSVKPSPSPSTKPNVETVPENSLNVTYVTKSSVNFRQGPGTNYKTYGTIKSGTEVLVLEYTNSSWYKVSYNGRIGYVSSNYLTEKVESPLSSNNVIVISSTANIRTGASTSKKVVTTVKRGTELTVLGTKSNWYKVSVNNKTGYIRNDLVSTDLIIVDISDQMLYYFKGNKTVLTAPVVTGMKGKHDTPLGNYTLYKSNKETSRYLKGNNDDGTRYNAFVNYWMPFNGGVGFHDATWRSSSEFNKNQYKSDGSHGCVNMKKADAKVLYNNTTKDTAVKVRQ